MITYGTGTYAGVMVVITGDIADVAAAVQSGMTAQGYTTARAGEISAIKAKADTLVNGPTLAEIEGSALAKEATVESRASQASVNALGTPAQASTLAALATANQAEHDATQAAIAALPAPLDATATQAAAAAALTAYDPATGAEVAAAQAAIIAEVEAIPAIPATDLTPVLTAIDALPEAPTTAQVADAVRTRIKPDLETINAGVKLASLGIPHSEDLEA